MVNLGLKIRYGLHTRINAPRLRVGPLLAGPSTPWEAAHASVFVDCLGDPALFAASALDAGLRKSWLTSHGMTATIERRGLWSLDMRVWTPLIRSNQPVHAWFSAGILRVSWIVFAVNRLRARHLSP